jgi:hypothetical protein
MSTSGGLRRLWRPSVDTLEAIAGVLREHWRAAAKMRPQRLFWPTPVSWLKSRPLPESGPEPLTTSPGVGGSSDKPPDPRP